MSEEIRLALLPNYCHRNHFKTLPIHLLPTRFLRKDRKQATFHLDHHKLRHQKIHIRSQERLLLVICPDQTSHQQQDEVKSSRNLRDRFQRQKRLLVTLPRHQCNRRCRKVVRKLIQGQRHQPGRQQWNEIQS